MIDSCVGGCCEIGVDNQQFSWSLRSIRGNIVLSVSMGNCEQQLEAFLTIRIPLSVMIEAFLPDTASRKSRLRVIRGALQIGWYDDPKHQHTHPLISVFPHRSQSLRAFDLSIGCRNSSHGKHNGCEKVVFHYSLLSKNGREPNCCPLVMIVAHDGIVPAHDWH